MLCFWTKEFASSSASPSASQRADPSLYPAMANDAENSQGCVVPGENPGSMENDVHSSRSASLEAASGKSAEKIGLASMEKLSSTGNSTEKNSIASEKIAASSRSANEATGDREYLHAFNEQQHTMHSNTNRQDLQAPDETAQQPSRRLSPVSGIFTSQRRDGAHEMSVGKSAMPHTREKENFEREVANEVYPALTSTARRSSLRGLALKRAVRRRFTKRPQHLARLPGAVKGMKKAMNNWCQFLSEQALTLSIIFGLLSVLLMVVAVTSNSWRTHSFTFDDVNGRNTVTVHAGLSGVQRIHKLSKHNDMATLYLVDAARSFRALIDSPYCVEEENDDYERWTTWLNKKSLAAKKTSSTSPETLIHQPGRRLSDTDIDAPSDSRTSGTTENDRMGETEQEKKTEADPPVEPDTNLDSREIVSDDDTAAEEDTEKSVGGQVPQRKVEGLAPFELVFGRDPAAAGNMTPAASKLRRTLLGPVIFELNCRYLPKLKLAGEALWLLIFPALLLSGAALMVSWLSTNWIRSLFGRLAYPASASLLISGVFWLLAVVLTVAGLSSWGAISDVAACVSDIGGASVCMLGPSTYLAIAALALQVLAAVCCGFCLAGSHGAPKSRMLQESRLTRSASPVQANPLHEDSTCQQKYTGAACHGHHIVEPKDVAIEIQDNEPAPSGEQTPPTVAGQEHGSRRVTTTESRSEAGIGNPPGDASNSRLRSRELAGTEACAADRK